MPRVTEPPEDLLDLIYDAATDEGLWTTALSRISDITSGLGGFIHGMQNRERLVPFMFNARMNEESHRVYAERHMDNAWSAYMKHVPVGSFVQSNDIMPLTDLQRSAFFDEVLRPQDMAHNFMVPLAASQEFQVGFNICRSERQGPFEADALRLFSQLYPHLRRALLLGFRLDGYKALQSAAFHVLDRLSAGFIILDRATRVLFANAAARSIASDGGALRLRNGSVVGAYPTYGQQLERLIQAAVRGMPVATMSIPHPQDDRVFTVLASSIRSRDIDRFSGLGMRDPAVMLVITDPLRPLDIPAEWIMDAYGLTQAEANVALASASGASIPEIAQRLSVSPNTVKTHLRRVFAKTGVSRQAELARVTASLAMVGSNAPIAPKPNGD